MRNVLLFTMLSAISGSAAALTGNQLYEFLKQPSRDIAMAYIEGVIDSAVVIPTESASTTSAASWAKLSIRKYTFCTPRSITRKQLADVVQKWLEVRPEVRNNLAHELIGAALENSYPCYR